MLSLTNWRHLYDDVDKYSSGPQEKAPTIQPQIGSNLGRVEVCPFPATLVLIGVLETWQRFGF
jgi:hypothetical protein